MKIFNLIIMKYKDYEFIFDCHKRDVERIRKNHAAYVGTLAEEKHSLEDKIKALEAKHLKDLDKHITIEHSLKDNITRLELEATANKNTIESLKKSNAGYKSNNTRLKNEKKILQKELDNSFKRTELPPDKTKSKQVPKVKSSSKQSSLVKMMNR